MLESMERLKRWAWFVALLSLAAGPVALALAEDEECKKDGQQDPDQKCKSSGETPQLPAGGTQPQDTQPPRPSPPMPILPS